MYKYLLLTTCLLGTVLYNFVGNDASLTAYDFPEETPGKISFIGNAGSDNVFEVERWKFNNVSIPDNDFSQLALEAELDMTSINTGWTDLLKSVKKKKDYFHIKKFPTAKLNVDGAELQEDGSYVTEALLTLKGITKKVKLTYTVSGEPPYVVAGEGVIKRRKFSFTGGGPKNEVPVKFEAVLP